MQAVPFEAFQPAALAAAGALLPHDASWWGLSSGLEIHTQHVTGLDPGFRDAWDPIKDHDGIAQAVFEDPGRTVHFGPGELSRWPRLALFLAGYDIRHVLCTVLVEPSLGLTAFLSLYRRNRPFSEADRQLKQVVFPHLCHALNQSWQRALTLVGPANGRDGARRLRAVCDPDGLVFTADTGFAALLRAEFSDWVGPLLPRALVEALRRAPRFDSHRLDYRWQRLGRAVLLEIAPLGPLRSLTLRERQVAERYASGMTHKGIARDLGLSPTTVRHYIRNCFGKLHISDKAALASLMVESGPV